MTIESLGRKGGPKPGDLGATPRHSRRPQPETRIVPTARPKPAPPRTPPGVGEARRAVPQPPAQRPGPQSVQEPQGTQGTQAAPQAQNLQEPQRAQGTQTAQRAQAQGPGAAQAQAQTAQTRPQAPAQAQARVSEAKPARPPEARTTGDRGPGPNLGQQKPRGRNEGKTENRGERSLYDGGSPSANRLGPAKAMRARDVSRPRDW